MKNSKESFCTLLQTAFCIELPIALNDLTINLKIATQGQSGQKHETKSILGRGCGGRKTTI